MRPTQTKGKMMNIIGFILESIGAIIGVILLIGFVILTAKLVLAYIKAVKKTRAGEMIVFTDWKDVGKSLYASFLMYVFMFTVVSMFGYILYGLLSIGLLIVGKDSHETFNWLMIIGLIASCIVAPFWIKYCIRYLKNSYQYTLNANQGNIENTRLAIAAKFLTIFTIIPAAIAGICFAIGSSFFAIKYRQIDNTTTKESKEIINKYGTRYKRHYTHKDTTEEARNKDIKLAGTLAMNAGIAGVSGLLLAISVGLIDSENKKRWAKQKAEMHEDDAETVEAQEILNDEHVNDSEGQSFQSEEKAYATESETDEIKETIEEQ